MQLHRWAPCALALIPLLASAAPIDDVRAGTNLFLNHVKASVDGESAEAMGYEIPKAAGTLDLDVSLANFGLSDTQNIHATASVHGNKIVWSFDKTFSPPVAVDSSTELRRAWGFVVVSVEPLTPEEEASCFHQPCERNARLQLSEGSQVFVSGEGSLGFDFTEFVDLKRLKAMGGVPRPNLATFTWPATVYTRSTEQFVYPYLTLTSPAPSNGAQVSFWSSAPSASFSAPNVVLPQGQQQGTAGMRIAPNFSGTFTVRASAGGSIIERQVTIAPEADTNKKKNPFLWAEWVPEILAGCIKCSGFISHPATDVSIGMLNGVPTLVQPGKLTNLDKRFNARVSPTMMNAQGWATGTLVNATGTHAFLANLRDPNAKARLYQGFTPVSINAFGAVLGNTNAAAPWPVILSGGKLKSLALPSGVKEARATSLSTAGYVVGTALDSTGTWGFRHFKGLTTRLHTAAAGTTYTPVAVNDSGEVAAFVQQRLTRSPVRTTRSGVQQSLGSISGYGSAWPTAQNDLGWIVGTASNGTTTTGFLWTSSDGMLDLNRFSPSLRVVVREALAVTNDKQVVVRAVVNGRDDLYVLSF